MLHINDSIIEWSVATYPGSWYVGVCFEVEEKFNEFKVLMTNSKGEWCVAGFKTDVYVTPSYATACFF